MNDQTAYKNLACTTSLSGMVIFLHYIGKEFFSLYEELEKDRSDLSDQQQERYVDLQSRTVPAAPSKDQDLEL